jgi:hypothetical protein
VKFIEREHIDTKLWDQKISENPTENIFCYSWYLDATAKNWGALVTDNYKTIVPIPFTKKLGVKQMYQPQFSRELDIFGIEFNWEDVLEFLSNDFKAIQFRNENAEILKEKEERFHQVLDLTSDFKFKTNAKRLIKKADQQFEYRNEAEPSKLIELFKSTAFQKIDTLNNDDLIKLEGLMNYTLKSGNGELIAVYEQNQFVGAGFFLIDDNRITYLKSASHEQPKKDGAMYGLVNHAIYKFKESYKTFDFGGSDVESVANFYKKFGSTNRSYYNYTINHLPLWFKTLKRIKG